MRERETFDVIAKLRGLAYGLAFEAQEPEKTDALALLESKEYGMGWPVPEEEPPALKCTVCGDPVEWANGWFHVDSDKKRTPVHFGTPPPGTPRPPGAPKECRCGWPLCRVQEPHKPVPGPQALPHSLSPDTYCAACRRPCKHGPKA